MGQPFWEPQEKDIAGCSSLGAQEGSGRAVSGTAIQSPPLVRPWQWSVWSFCSAHCLCIFPTVYPQDMKEYKQEPVKVKECRSQINSVSVFRRILGPAHGHR